MSQTNGPTCGIYTRISDVKGQPGIGVARQEKLCRELAEQRGYTNIAVYSDDDRSAWSGKPRPGWKALLKAIESKEVQAVIAYEPSRLYRHTRDLDPLIDLLDKFPIDMTTVMDGELNLSSPQGRAIAKTIATWDGYESDVKSSRVKAQRDEAAKEGEWQGKPRYGYTLEDGQLVIDPEQADVIRRIISEVRQDRSYRSIAIGLNEDGISPPSGQGKWGSRKVSATLTPTIAGMYVHRGQVVGKGNWEPIVTRSQFEAAQAIADARKRSGKNQGQPAKYLLTGFLKCGLCGESLYYQKRGSGSYAYKCNKRPDGGCGRLSISAEVDEKVAGWLTLILMMTKPTKEVGTDDTTSPDDIVSQIEDIEARMDDLASDFYAHDLIGEREYRAARQGLENKLTELREELGETAKIKRQTIGVDWMAEWETATIPERREFLGSYVDHITVNPGKKGARGVDTSRLKITWKADS